MDSPYPSFEPGHSVPVKGHLNAAAYKDILDTTVLPTVRQQFVFDSFLRQHDDTSVHASTSDVHIILATWIINCFSSCLKFKSFVKLKSLCSSSGQEI